MRSLPRIAAIVGFVVLGVLGATARTARSCPRGYESRIRLAKGAHHILDVDVLSVEDVTPPAEPGRKDRAARTYERARAHVRVVTETRGLLPMKEFTLVGGPYDSCAPYAQYLRFDVGERVTLILADPVPPGTEEIVVSWRCRVATEDREYLGQVLRRGTDAWEKRLALLRRVAPKEMEAAAGLLASRGADGDWSAADLRALPYPVLAGLAELQRDPTRPWRPVPAPSDAEAPLPPTSYEAGRSKGSPLTPRLADEFGRRCAGGAKESADVVAFHRTALASWLTVELGQSAARAARFVAAVTEDEFLREIVPLDGLSRVSEDDPELHSVAILLDLTSDEPDSLVWQSFSLGKLEPSVFAPWLKVHGKELPTNGPYLKVLLAIRSPEAAPRVEQEFADAGDEWRMDDFLAFFVAVGDGPHADEVVRRLTRLVDAAMAPSGDEAKRVDLVGNARWSLESARKALADASERAKPYVASIDAQLARLPK